MPSRKRKEDPEPEPSSASGVLETILSIVGATRDLIGELTGKVEGMVDHLAARVIRSLLSALFLFFGAVIVLLGVFFLLIDLGGVPRGVVFTVGGLILVLLAVILLLVGRRR